MDIRTGLGIDFHTLIRDKQRPLLLGGFEIESNFALAGHSDADLILHALSDAILGALGEDDIGEHFSDQDPAHANKNSAAILAFALEKMRKKGLAISNADITVLGETPRISPYKSAIAMSLGRLLGLPISRISMKATTTEKMGALGRKEGLGCLANVLLITANKVDKKEALSQE